MPFFPARLRRRLRSLLQGLAVCDLRRSVRPAAASLAQAKPCLSAALRALLPSSCALCGGAAPDVLCAGCRTQCLALKPQRCRQCALPVPTSADLSLCGACLATPPAFDATIVVADYAPPVDSLVLGLKFGAQLALAPCFARLLAEAMQAHELPALIVPVPLGMRRLRERGYNQALEIARPLARSLGLPLQFNLLQRQKETSAQARLTPQERRRNVKHAFAMAPDVGDILRGLHVGVVDDVMTTGATLDELAALLKRHGAARVSNLVFARTPPA